MKEFLKGLVKTRIKFWLLGILFSTTGLIIAGITIFIVVLVLIFGGAEEEGNAVDAGCSVGMSGGDISKEGMKLFAQNAKGGAFEGKTDLFVKVAKKYKIAPSLLAAIVASESGWGKSANATVQHNPMSLMGSGSLWQFDTIEAGLDRGAKNLYDLYIKEGLTTPEKIGPKYAPVGASNDPSNLNSNWIKTVKQIMGDLQSDKPITSETISDCSDDGANQGETLKSLEKYHGNLPKTKFKEFNPNYYAYHQCTWWVYNRRLELGLPCEKFFGNGGQWAYTAKQQGYSTGKKPVQGAMASTPGPTQYGHIMFVEKVLDGGKKIKISEYNWIPYEYGERIIPVTPDITFIYDKVKK